MAFLKLCDIGKIYSSENNVVSVFVVIELPVLIFSDGTLLYFPLWLFFTAIAGIAGCMMIVSLLPILSFTRKTPVEILSKYDV